MNEPATEPRVFLDTSALFAGIWSETGGSGQVLRLGEAGVIQLCVGEQVLDELESTLEDKAPEALGELTVLLDRSGIDIVDEPTSERITQLNQYLSYKPDARVLACAVENEVDWFLTYDQSDFLDNERLKEQIPCEIGTAGDFVEEFKGTLK